MSKTILSKIGRPILSIFPIFAISIQQIKQAEAFVEAALILGAGALWGIAAEIGSGSGYNNSMSYCDYAWARSNATFDSGVELSKREEWVEAAAAFKNSWAEWERTSYDGNCSAENRSRAAENMALATRNYNLSVKNDQIVRCNASWKDSQETFDQGFSVFNNSNWSSAAPIFNRAAEKWERTASICQKPDMKNAALQNIATSRDNSRKADRNLGVARNNERCTSSLNNSLSASDQAFSIFNQGLWKEATSAYHRAAANWESTASECSPEAIRREALENKAIALDNERLANKNYSIVQNNAQIKSCLQSFESGISLTNEANTHIQQNNLKQAGIVLRKAEQSWDKAISLCVQNETSKARQEAINNKKDVVRVAQEIKCKELSEAVISAASQIEVYVKDGKWNETMVVSRDAADTCDKAVLICPSDDVKKVFRENKARFMETAKASDQVVKLRLCNKSMYQGIATFNEGVDHLQKGNAKKAEAKFLLSEKEWGKAASICLDDRDKITATENKAKAKQMAQATAKAVVSGLPIPATGAKKGETSQRISISMQTSAGKEPEERNKNIKGTAASITQVMSLNDGGLNVSIGKNTTGSGEAREALISAHDQLEKNNNEIAYQMKSFIFLKD